ncbi:DUF6094 domain-containing protein [Paenibacillus glucanolyticus]|uniref:DUF6094 domain-containing protein n=1 Tax=Paenibacillus glucanolyticus TaxID=59843 RepID=UPI0015C3951E|nr:DUF6094 domain-containing protein [Paenibacillus glucanolyticus]
MEIISKPYLSLSTPIKEMELILRRVHQENDYPFSIFDPCAGTGAALLQIKNHFSNSDMVESYGIEIEKTRAYEAKRNVDHLLHCGYEDTRISHDTFSLMYLNPPFMQLKNERSEYRFFKDLTQSNNTLSTSALVILNVPQYTFSGTVQDHCFQTRGYKSVSFYRRELL